MLICNNCGFIFSEGWAESHGAVNGFLACPSCDSEDLDPAKECASCGEDVREDDLVDGCCPDCRSDALAKLRTVIFSKMFTPAQSAWLREYCVEV